MVLKQQENHIVFFHAINTLSKGLGSPSSTRNKLWYSHVFLTAVFFLDLCSIVLDEVGEIRSLTLTYYVNLHPLNNPYTMADFYTGFLPSCKARSWPTCWKRAVTLTSVVDVIQPAWLPKLLLLYSRAHSVKNIFERLPSPPVSVKMKWQYSVSLILISTKSIQVLLLISLKVWPLRSIIHTS